MQSAPLLSTHYLIKMDHRLQVISLIMPQWQDLYPIHTYPAGMQFKYFYKHIQTAFILALCFKIIFIDFDNTTVQAFDIGKIILRNTVIQQGCFNSIGSDIKHIHNQRIFFLSASFKFSIHQNSEKKLLWSP